jgi:hypothetical protein
LKTQTITQETILDYGIPDDEAYDNSEDRTDITTPDDYTDGPHRFITNTITFQMYKTRLQHKVTIPDSKTDDNMICRLDCHIGCL